MVTYNAQGQAAIGGLGSGRDYGVLVTGERSLKLGTTFSSTLGNTEMIDLETDTIRFAFPHRLENNDRVIYRTDNGAVVGGLANDETYLVRKVSDTEIKLIAPNQIPAAPQPFSGADITGDTITRPGHGFAHGQPVTYRQPEASLFTIDRVDVVGGPYNPNDPRANLAPVDNNNVYLPGHSFQAGDELIYRASDRVPIPELTSGQRYFAIVDPTKPDEIQLARLWRTPWVTRAIPTQIRPFPRRLRRPFR